MLASLLSTLLFPAPKHVVLLAGDEEYRSEEVLPQLAQILTKRHGFRCTVLHSVNSSGEIDPTETRNQPGLEALKTADLCIMMLRFRAWPDAQMKHFADFVDSKKPIIALRTSTHAFNFLAGSTYSSYTWNNDGGFGRRVLGETWVSHWGEHGKEATRGILNLKEAKNPILNGVKKPFGTTDVYEAHPPADAKILLYGEVVSTLAADAPPAKRQQKGQDVNDPMMPITWTLERDRKVLTITMGSATDFLNPDLRRLVVNGAFWAVGQKVPRSANVELVGTYEPSSFGFGGFKKGVPSTIEL